MTVEQTVERNVIPDTQQAPTGRPAAENELTTRFLQHPAAAARLTRNALASPLLTAAYRQRLLGRPVFLDAGQRASLESDLGAMHELLVSLPARLFAGSLAAMGRAVGMSPVQIEGVLRNAVECPVRLARADIYQEEDGFRLLEFNTGTALGGSENAELNRALLQDPDFSEFVESEGLEFTDTLRGIVNTMISACPGLDLAGRPTVALTDWPASFTDMERRLSFFARLLEPMGFDAIACHIGQIEERAGALFVHGRRIDIVYRFFLIEDLDGADGMPACVQRVLAAAERGTVRLFAPLESDLYGSKGALALLSDERHRSAFTVDELSLIDRFLPWTRELRPGRVHAGGYQVDLIDHVCARREELILKPTIMYGGTGVIPGWKTDQAEWERQVRGALGGPYVVQRRVRPVAERFGQPATGSAELCYLNWGVFLVSSGYGGAIVRGSAEPDVGVVSMSNGALTGCCFHPRRPARQAPRAKRSALSPADRAQSRLEARITERT
jgi:hypothetical protein